ncbi:McrB family protein [Shewanella acanthi]|uniref:McrB family protein n=1 Tax=Shewanella acanthi TaxID=2864212 RepID=UPI001C657C31|nr:AAA family ATPase [Shewanella acanthi]QYJ78845.1 AAA family ATPase [Shewanella acanthi]
MLQDLLALKLNSQRLIEDNFSLELFFDDRSKYKILELYNKEFPNYPATLQDGLLKITNDKKQTAYLPFNWFVRIKQCKHLIEALVEYSEYVDMLKSVLNDDTLRALPKVDWESSTEIPDDQKFILNNFINEKFPEEEQNKLFRDFVDGRSWLDLKSDTSTTLTGKKFNRQNHDYIASCITTHCKLINDTAGKLEHFIRLYITNSDIRDIIEGLPVSEASNTDDLSVCEPTITPYIAPTLTKPISATLKTVFKNTAVNKIIYGAPGTGKSYSLKNAISEEKLIRTVFHPDTLYSDFVGSLKPMMHGSTVGYEFRPGPFTEAIIRAVNEPTESFSLVIEELNRASAAAVFGEIFQLLDRNKSGHSEYMIDISDPDFRDYLNLKTNQFFSHGQKLFIPSNLSLLATMNSSDQAVKPLDTAFKRRWSFEYIQIDYSKATPGQLSVPFASGIATIEWAKFAEIINQRLQNLGVPEDRLLGHRFLSDQELSTPETAANSLCGKLFVYLWDDVLRHGRRDVIFNTADFGTFGALVNGFKNGRSVFCEELEEDLSSAVDTSNANSEPEATEKYE